jgi:hypothetical protein
LRDSKVIEKEFLTADVALEKRKSMLRCSTGREDIQNGGNMLLLQYFGW